MLPCEITSKYRINRIEVVVNEKQTLLLRQFLSFGRNAEKSQTLI